MSLLNLTPNVPIKISYNYSPLWRDSAGKSQIYRGTNEKIIMFPQANQVELNYRLSNSIGFIFGVLVSLLTLMFMGLVIFYQPTAEKALLLS
jgi:hypothetical protein